MNSAAVAGVPAPATRNRDSGAPAGPPRRLGEALIELWIRGSGVLSILVTVGIVVVLAKETIGFFAEVSLEQFLGDTVWAPLGSEHPRFGIWPLVVGTLLTTAIAMLVAVPLGLLAAIYLSEYAAPRTRRLLKPALELLAGVPTIVYGFFALTTVTPALKGLVPGLAGFNALSPGIVMGLMIVPLVTSLSEDALYAVPQSLREAAYGLGARKLDAIRRVVVPSAWSGIAAACTLAVSRAIGETMIVAIAAGQNTRVSLDPREPSQTMTAFIVDVSKGETPAGSLAYGSIYAVATVLFVMTLGMNLLSHRLSRRLRAQARA